MNSAFITFPSHATRYLPLLRKALSVVKAQKANIMCPDPSTGLLKLVAVWGQLPTDIRDAINSGQAETRSFNMGEGVVGKCAASQQIICVNKAYLIPPYSDFSVYGIVSVPIVINGRLEAVMTVTNKVKDHDTLGPIIDVEGQFTQADIDHLAQLVERYMGIPCPTRVSTY
ncbi:MAG: GAF domain-containing protein [Cyanobacteria bacterium HKST-UBA04]|nr:GAF domain-containing protein [Cyanobacteria bacterium HKST-UBA04]